MCAILYTYVQGDKIYAILYTDVHGDKIYAILYTDVQGDKILVRNSVESERATVETAPSSLSPGGWSHQNLN